MNEVLKTIYERRAVRKFRDKAVDTKIIEQLIDAGRMAPSAINNQPWKFYVVTNKDDIKVYSKEITISALKSIPKMGVKNIAKAVVSGISHITHLSEGIDFVKAEDPVFHGAPVVIFITAPAEYEWAGLDIGMCTQNMMLAAKSLGLDTCPVGFGKFIMQAKSYSKLKIPKKEEVLISLIVGYGDESPVLHERKKDNVTFL
ncbi:MAG: nitroreductase [Bacteroidia bacterium]